jgi:formylglycine-generating enzyme required for sulfatase activity
MKHIIFKFLQVPIILISGGVLLSNCNTKSSTGWEYNTSEGFEIPIYKELNLNDYYLTQDIKFIEGGSFRMPPDTSAIASRYVVSSLYLLDHEITNGEYLEFVNWMKKREIMELIAESNPDRRLENGNYNENLPITKEDEIFLAPLYLKVNNEKQFNNHRLLFKIPKKAREYYGLKNDSIIEIYPDTTCFEREVQLEMRQRIYMRNYFSNPRYADYPVVGINWLQAIAYCEWRTDRLYEDVLLKLGEITQKSVYNTAEILQVILNEKNKSNGNIFIKSPGYFRLPTESEWILATRLWDEKKGSIGQIYAWEGMNLTNRKGEYYANFCQKEFEYCDPYEFPAPSKSFHISPKGVYNLCGNVAELTTSKITNDNVIIKGGSWADTFESMVYTNFQSMNYRSSSARVGFRVALDSHYQFR